MAALTLSDKEYRSRRFARYLDRVISAGIPYAQAVGELLLFWDHSRESDVTAGAAKLIKEFLPDRPGLCGADFLFSALVTSGYLVQTGQTDHFVIDGNQHALERRNRLRAQATKSRRPKVARKRSKKAAVVQADAPDASSAPQTQAPVHQPSKGVPERTDFQWACYYTWIAYAKAFEQKTARLPVRNQKVNALIQQLVKRLGEKRAPIVVQFYVEHANDSFYIKALWPLDLLLRRAETFDNQCNIGRSISTQTANHMASEVDFRQRQRALLHESP